MTPCAGAAWCKGCNHKGPMVGQRQQKEHTRDNVVQGTQKGQTFGRRRQAQLECSNGIRDQDFEEQLHLGSVKTLYEAHGQTHALEIMKQTMGSSVRIRKMSKWTLLRGWLPSK
jgi:hypothetical protein